MATPAKKLITRSYAELQQLYDSDGWAARLQSGAVARTSVESSAGRGDTIQKTLRKYFDADGNTLAVIWTYKKPTGTVVRIRMLRDGDTAYVGPISINKP